MKNTVKGFNERVQAGEIKLFKESKFREYYVSNNSEMYTKNKLNGEIKSYKGCNAGGYVGIHINKKTYYAHLVVLELFVGLPEKGQTANHKDGNKKNFSLDNLEYISHSENLKHAYENGLVKKNTGSKKTLDFEQAKEIREKYEKGNTSTSKLAQEYGVSRMTISRVINKKTYIEKIA